MSGFRRKMQHAFAVDPPGPEAPRPQEQEPVDWFCRQVARHHLTTPGLIALEVARPLNFVAAQAMHFLSPAVWALARPRGHERYRRFAEFLERRGSTEYLAARIEYFEAELERRRREGAETGEHAEHRPGPGPEA